MAKHSQSKHSQSIVLRGRKVDPRILCRAKMFCKYKDNQCRFQTWSISGNIASIKTKLLEKWHTQKLRADQTKNPEAETVCVGGGGRGQRGGEAGLEEMSVGERDPVVRKFIWV